MGLFGIHLEGKLSEVDANSKKSAKQKEMARKMLLARYLGEQQT